MSTGLPRLLAPIVTLRADEARTVVLMFAYAFFAMTAYNIVQPVTRSAFIADLGADNVPYVLLAGGLLSGVIMYAYGRVVAALPGRWALPIVQLALSVLLIAFFLALQTGRPGVAFGFYLFGQIMGTLLLSQFWSLANEVYDPRQARRLFGFIGSGASLGGMTGSGFAALIAGPIGTNTLLVVSAATLAVASVVVTAVLRRERHADRSVPAEDTRPTAGLSEGWQLMSGSPSLRRLTLLISLSALGAMLVDQQLNLAAEEFRGSDQDAVTRFLASVRFILSTVSFVTQLVLVRHIYRLLGVGFALVLLPLSLGLTSVLILLSGALWAPAVASVVDRSIRYTVDRTTREIFFLPLPSELTQRVKSFIDVTADRLARGVGAVLVLVAIKPWGLGLHWPQLSLATVTLVGFWLWVAGRAREDYVSSMRQGLERQLVDAAEMRVGVADLTTVETLLEELAHPEAQRVLYAIDVLESLDKHNLVTPLLLRHASPAVRARALAVMSEGQSYVLDRWQPLIREMVDDSDAEVRANAIVALASARRQDTTRLARELLADASTGPAMAVSASVVLAASPDPTDVDTAETTLTRLATDRGAGASSTRRDVARALRRVEHSRLRQLLIPLLMDTDGDVADEAMRSVRAMRPNDPLFVPTLVSLLGERRLESGARQTLVGYGEPVVDMLRHVLTDPNESPSIRQRIPATVARIPSQTSMDLLVSVLDTADPRVRDASIAAMEVLSRHDPTLVYPKESVERLLIAEARAYFGCFIRRHEIFTVAGIAKTAVLHEVLTEQLRETVDRVYRLLSLLHPWRDVAAVRSAATRGTPSERASAFEFLDNVLPAFLRSVVLPMLEDGPIDEKLQRGHALRRTHPEPLEEALLALINDDDEIIAAAAIDLVRTEEYWTLRDDVEYVLAHRDARDWLVFEAASWTLAATRLTSSERRARWREPLPAIVLAGRLRQLPMFSATGTEEMCRLARAGRQLRHDDGTVLLREGTIPPAFHVLLDGRVTSGGSTSDDRSIDAPALLGFRMSLERSPAVHTVVASGPIVTVVVSREDLLRVLTGHTGLVTGLFRTLLALGGTRAPVVLPGSRAPHLVAGRETPWMSQVEKMLALQHVPVFSRVASEELTHLSDIATLVPLEPEGELSDPSSSPAVYVVLSGAISVRDATTEVELGRADAGDTVGVFETLASADGRSLGAPTGIRVLTDGLALRLTGPDLLDVLVHRPLLLQHLFAAVFRTAETA